MAGEERRFNVRIGPVQVDVPKSVGYFGGVWLACAAGVIDPPLGVFIAAIPFVKLMRLSRLPPPINVIGDVIEGVAKPVGGDDEAVVRPADDDDAGAPALARPPFGTDATTDAALVIPPSAAAELAE